MYKVIITMLLILSTTALATDTYNATTNILNIDAVILNGVQYNNVVVNMGKNFSVISVGSSSPVTGTDGSSTITLAQLNACPNTSKSTATQFWSCFSGTLVGVEYGQTYPCTLKIGNGQISMSTTDQNLSISGTLSSPFYSKSPSILPSAVFFPINDVDNLLSGKIETNGSSPHITVTMSQLILSPPQSKSMLCEFMLP
jgi:hypothetical protein